MASPAWDAHEIDADANELHSKLASLISVAEAMASRLPISLQRQPVSLHLFAKSISLVRSIHLLCSANQPTEALVLTRTLFEVLLHLDEIEADSDGRDERTSRFLAENELQNAKWLSEGRALSLDDEWATVPPLRAEVARPTIEAKFTKKPWYSVQELCKRADRRRFDSQLMRSMYAHFYRHASKAAHGTDLSDHLAIAQPDGGLERLQAIDAGGVSLVLGTAFARQVVATIDERYFEGRFAVEISTTEPVA